jgi:hypothetical protein
MRTQNKESKYEPLQPLLSPGPPVDGAILVESDKGLRDGPAHLGVHGEAGPVPVYAGAQGAQLRVDSLPVLLLPLPHLVDKGFAAQVVSTETLLPGDFLLHHHLGKNTPTFTNT